MPRYDMIEDLEFSSLVLIFSSLALLGATRHLALMADLTSGSHFDGRVLHRRGLKGHLVATLFL